MAYELLDRAGLTKVVSEISAKVHEALSDTKAIEVVTSGTPAQNSLKFYYNSTTNDLMARPKNDILHIPSVVSGYTVNTVDGNKGEAKYDLPAYLRSSSEYEEQLEYLAIGTRAGVGPYATAVGSNAEAWNDYSIAVGTRAFAGASSYVDAISRFGDLMPGAKESFRRTGSTAVGALAQAGGACTSVGRSAYAWLDSGTAIGAASNAGGEYATSLGEETTAASTGSTALGSKAAASAQYATAIGYQAAVSADAYRGADQYVSAIVSLQPTDEENLSVALGAFSTVRPGQNDVVSVGSEMQDFVRNFFNGVTAKSSASEEYAYDWVTETSERGAFYRRVVNVKDPLEDHDAATKGYVDKLTGVLPTKNKDGIYSWEAIETWIGSFPEQRLLVKIQPKLGGRAWSTTYSGHHNIFTEISALVGDTDVTSGHGVGFCRPCYMDENKYVTWIRGIDPEDGTQPNYVLTPALCGTVTYDTSTDTICDGNHGAITWLTIGTRWHEGDAVFQYNTWMPRYPVVPSDTSAIPASGAAYCQNKSTSKTDTIPTEMLWYIQTMWLLKYSNTWAGQWMDIGANNNQDGITMLDPTEYGGEYGESQDCIYLTWNTEYLYKQFPSGCELTIENLRTAEVIQTEVLFSAAYDDDSGVLCVYVEDFFTYEKGDTVNVSFIAPYNRRTGETDGWLNDGWEDASAFSGQFRMHQGSDSGYIAQLSADTAVSAYRLCDIELGLGAGHMLGEISIVQPIADSWDYLQWKLVTTVDSEEFDFPFYNLSGYTSVPSQASTISNALYLSEGTNGNWLWGAARFASDYTMKSYSGPMGMPFMTSLNNPVNTYISWSNESVLINSQSLPRPCFFYYYPYSVTARNLGTKYPPVVKLMFL